MEDYDDQMDMDFEQGPSLRQVLNNGATYAVFDEDGNAVPSWSAPANLNVSGVVSGAEGAALPISFVGVASDPDLGYGDDDEPIESFF